MARYFLEVQYNGTLYSGFQVQKNGHTIQEALQTTLSILLKEPVSLTGSSRTDAGVHALQNFFHLDTEQPISDQLLYKANAILPKDIVIKNSYLVKTVDHSRYSAVARTYHYHVARVKHPFLVNSAYFFPYTLDIDALQTAASLICRYQDFTSFSKKNTQVKSFLCKVTESKWVLQEDQWVYIVTANRFLRGMVRGLAATLLQVGRGKISIDRFKQIIEAKNSTLADFSAPAHGLFLVKVYFSEGVLDNPIKNY
jgi:tRNA pseudouridine38-40 synthase